MENPFVLKLYMSFSPARVGRALLRAIDYGGGYVGTLYAAIRGLPYLKIQPVRTVFLRQVYFTGIEALGIISLIATFIGFVIVTEVYNLVGASSALTGRVLAWVVVREMGPLFSSIIIIARSGTAVASELGAMKVGKEVEQLRLMGIEPINYLIMTRVAAIVVSVVVLTFYFNIAAVAGGVLLSSVFLPDIGTVEHLKGVFLTLSAYEIAVSFIKSLFFGSIISAVVCYQGFSVRASITEIPQAATRAVMQSIFLIIIFDGLITYIAFL